MALIEVRVDDTDGTHDAETHVFELDGETFEIDLVADNFKELQDALRPYMDAGRKNGADNPVEPEVKHEVKVAKKAAVKMAPYNRDVDKKAVRSWAIKHGYKIGDRGRIPGDIVDRYKAAHDDVRPTFSAAS